MASKLVLGSKVIDLTYYERWGADAARRGMRPIPPYRNGKPSWQHKEFGEAFTEGYEREVRIQMERVKKERAEEAARYAAEAAQRQQEYEKQQEEYRRRAVAAYEAGQAERAAQAERDAEAMRRRQARREAELAAQQKAKEERAKQWELERKRMEAKRLQTEYREWMAKPNMLPPWIFSYDFEEWWNLWLWIKRFALRNPMGDLPLLRQDIALRTANGVAVLIYRIICACGNIYDGQTRRLIRSRLPAHIKSKDGKETAVGHHIRNCLLCMDKGLGIKALGSIPANYLAAHGDGLNTDNSYRYPDLARLLEQVSIHSIPKEKRINLDVASEAVMETLEQSVLQAYGKIPKIHHFSHATFHRRWFAPSQIY